jgi:hypothetical protein
MALFFLFGYPFVPITGGLQVAYGISVIFHEITLQKVLLDAGADFVVTCNQLVLEVPWDLR